MNERCKRRTSLSNEAISYLLLLYSRNERLNRGLQKRLLQCIQCLRVSLNAFGKKTKVGDEVHHKRTKNSICKVELDLD